MGGFFSSFGKGLKGLLGDGDMMSTLAAARAYSDGDYTTGFRIGALAQENKRERAKEEQKAAAIESIRAGLRARGLADSDIDVLMADPGRASGLVADALKPWETGPGGGFRYDPAKNNWAGAPRVDDKGDYYGPTSDASQAPPLLREGVSDAARYAQSLGLQPGTPEYRDAIKDFVLKGNGPTGIAADREMLDRRFDNSAALRGMPTYGQAHRKGGGGSSGGGYIVRNGKLYRRKAR